MTDLIGDLDRRMAEVKAKFDASVAEKKRLLEQRSGLDRKLAEMQAEELKLDGRYMELADLKATQEGGVNAGNRGDEGAKN